MTTTVNDLSESIDRLVENALKVKAERDICRDALRIIARHADPRMVAIAKDALRKVRAA